MTTSRRAVLRAGGLMALAPISAGAAQFLAVAPAQAAVVQAAATPSAGFMAVARLITGQDAPDAALGARLHAALLQQAPGYEADLPALQGLLEKSGAGPLAFADAPAVDALYHRLLEGWYLGTVQTTGLARCIGFEDIASYAAVKHVMQPPSYCTGEPMFWTHDPQVADAN